MRFGRSTAKTPPTGLEDVPLLSLIEETRRRGYDLLPSASWPLLVRQLEQRAEEAEATLRAATGPAPERVDATELIKQLGHLAGEELPKACNFAIGLMQENAALERRAGRSEREASALAALLLDDFSALEGEERTE